jgi:hypothetical protein
LRSDVKKEGSEIKRSPPAVEINVGRTRIYQFPGGFIERAVFDDDSEEDPGFYLALYGRDEEDD